MKGLAAIFNHIHLQAVVFFESVEHIVEKGGNAGTEIFYFSHKVF